MTALVFASLIGAALVAGVFYAFSTFVMQALGRIDSRHGIDAMQSINVVVINPLFFLAFFGTGVLCVASSGVALGSGSGAGLPAVLAGGALYLVGCLGVTIVGNVPLNNRLARVEAGTEEAREVWGVYLRRWTFWNHVRTAASLAASVAYGWALLAG